MPIDVYKDWLGIPESVERPPDHYQLLRVAMFDDDVDRIQAHYKKLNNHVRKYATGQYSVQSQELLNELAKAMLCLTDPDRKRDYDESLGREFEVETDAHGRLPFLDILISDGQLSREQKREVESFASARGLSERDAVIQMKLVNHTTAAKALSKHLGLSYVELEDMLPEDEALDAVPRALVKKHTFLPLFVDEGTLLIACVDAPEHQLEDELRLRYGVPVRAVIATPRSINQAIAQHYAPGMRDEAVVKQVEAPKGKAKKAKAAKTEKPAVKKKVTAARQRFEDLSVEEQAQRKQYGMLMICWGIIVPMLPQILKSVAPLMAAGLPIPGLAINLLLMLPIAGAVTWFVTQKYWK
ncbi:MAG: general secretion pathway protein GspE [Planctomycetaceae bacterium]|nr:general secretion pathway protein GspE [Planctomycetaceae bacterium]